MQVRPTLAILGCLALVGAAHAEQPRGRDRRPPPRPGSVDADVPVPADTPRAPTDRLTKTPLAEYSKAPARPEIKRVEEAIYMLEKPSGTVWQLDADPAGQGARDVAFIAKQLDELAATLAAVRAKQGDWKRLAEYEQRLAYLRRAAAAQAAHYGAVTTAREQAMADAEAAADAAWAAKRAKDDGVVGPLHAASVGKVVFARAPITAATAAAAATTEVDVRDPLYLRAFVAQSPWNALHDAGVDCGREPSLEKFWITTTVAVNGGPAFDLETVAPDRATFQARTALDLTTGGAVTAGGTFGNDDEARGQMGWLTRVVGALAPGRNTVKLATRAGCYGSAWDGVALAEAELTIVATAATLAEVSKRGVFKMTPSSQKPAALAKARAKVVAAYADHELLDYRSVGDWQLRRNDLGVVLARELQTVALLRRRGTSSCQLASVVMTEAFDGRRYAPVAVGKTYDRPFVCNVK